MLTFGRMKRVNLTANHQLEVLDLVVSVLAAEMTAAEQENQEGLFLEVKSLRR